MSIILASFSYSIPNIDENLTSFSYSIQMSNYNELVNNFNYKIQMTKQKTLLVVDIRTPESPKTGVYYQ